MKILVFGVFSLLIGMFALSNAGCYAHANRASVGIELEVHTVEWHYYHDHDEGWRRHHPWKRYEWEHKDEKWRHEHPWHDED